MPRSCFFLLASLTMTSAAQAQTVTTDIAEKVETLLKQHGQVPLTVTTYTTGQRTVCAPGGHGPAGSQPTCYKVPYRVPHQTVTQVYLTASDLTIQADKPPAFGNPVIRSFPNDVLTTMQDNINCSSATGSANVSLSMMAERTHSVTLSKSLANTVNGSIGVQVPAFGGHVSASIGYSHTETTSTAHLDGAMNAYTIAGAGMISLMPHTRIVAALTAYRVDRGVPFTITVLADGDVSANDAGKHRLSEVFPPEARTFEVSGEVVSSGASTATLQFYDAPFKAEQCPSGAGIVQIDHQAEPELKLRPSTRPVSRLSVR